MPVHLLKVNRRFFDREDEGDMFLRNVLTFNGLHDIISQKTELFIYITLVQTP
jgi:hypothetical protein